MIGNMDSDEQLMVDYTKGNDQAFAELVSRYADHIYNFIFQYVKNHQDAEELTQATFLKVWKSAKRFDARKSFKSWIFKIARNTFLDYFRRKKISLVSIDSENEAVLETPSKQPDPSELFSKKDLSAEIKNFLDLLPEKYKTIINLYYIEGFNFREIGDLLKEPIDTVKSRHRRALIILKNNSFRLPLD